MVRGSLVANSMTSNDGMESMAHEVRLRQSAIKIWVLCHDMDGRLTPLMQIKLCADLDQYMYIHAHTLY